LETAEATVVKYCARGEPWHDKLSPNGRQSHVTHYSILVSQSYLWSLESVKLGTLISCAYFYWGVLVQAW